MLDLLIKRFVKDSENTGDPEVRARYGMFAGAAGILLNLLLFAGKFFAGLLTASISITADAFNNLSDAGSSVVTLIGFKMAGMPADSEHPFGHGRIEYLSGLAVSVAILLVGLELARGSLGKVLHPQALSFSPLSLAILAASVLVKLWMSWFNRALSRRIGSTAMMAASMDSLTDAVATTAVAAGVLANHFFRVNIDGWVGLLVACFILYTGYHTAKDSLSPLLGKAPDAEFVRAIGEAVLAHPEVVGIHDLIVHDYGPGRRIISLHAEVPCNADILVMHDAIDVIELELRHKFHCEPTIHMDPVAVDDRVTNEMRARVLALVRGIDPAISIHDFRLVQGRTHTNLIFDVLVPHKFRLPDAQVARLVREGVEALDGGHYYAVIRVEKAYV